MVFEQYADDELHYKIDLIYRVNALLRWSASSFSDALFCTYEQVRQTCNCLLECIQMFAHHLHALEYEVAVCEFQFTV